MKRRSFLALGTATSAVLVGGVFPIAAFGQSARKTLKLFSTTNLTTLDPLITPEEVVIQHGYYVYDTLYGMDDTFTPQPQMAERHSVSEDGRLWTFTLRDGLFFHDGARVTAVDCATSVTRWSQSDSFGRLLAKAVESISATDSKTLTIKLKSPFPRMLEALGKLHSSPCFIMPERFASRPTSEPVTEMIGSGPYRFLADEFTSGVKVVYEKFAQYEPRREPAAMTAGGKVAKFDRIEWTINTDTSTGVSALIQGEVDVLQYLGIDLIPLLEGRDDVKAIPFSGQVPIIRFNSVQPPFNNPALRRIAAGVVSQVDMLATQVDGNPDLYKECKAMFPCGFPGVVENGADTLDVYRGDYERAKTDLQSAGYKGEKVVILNPTTQGAISMMAVIAADQLSKAGFNVEVQDMDWGTTLQRGRSRESVENGGWSIACSAWPPIAISNPAVSVIMRGDGESYPGWYKNEELEALITDWVQAPTSEVGDKLFLQIQELLLREMPTVLLGEFSGAVASRSNITGLESRPVIYPWLLDRV